MSSRGSFKGLFNPANEAGVAGWLRLAASTANAGKWDNVADVLNPSNPATQPDTDRRPAVGTSNNGLPTMVFDGTDMLVWPLSANINNMTDKLGIWMWLKPGSIVGNQRLLSITSGNGASLSKLIIAANNAQLDISIFVTDATGRTGSRAATFAANTWVSIYMQYDSSRGGDPNLVVFVNGVEVTLTFANIGAGAALAALQAPTGNAIIGARNDSDGPTNPVLTGGEMAGIYTFNVNLTAEQVARFQAFEAPT